MGDRITESYPSQEPAPEYDWDYDDERGPRRGNVLWGRVIVLFVLLLLAFLLGRSTAPEGISAGDLRDARDEVEELEDENQALRDALSEPSPPATVTPTGTPTTAAEGEGEGEGTTLEGETYTVESGDTLRGIAQTFCGDPSLDDLIAEYNGIDDPESLSVGSEITIPPDCGE